jgi:phage gp36-like protein
MQLSALRSIELEVVTDKEHVALWNELVDRHHYLGYRHPIGAALKYFIISNTPTRQILGCLQFSASVWHLADRDSWIGWQTKDREQRLNLIINNTRFLILPWVKVNNLASHTLSILTHQIADDWDKAHAYRPVLIETFVDTSQYHGSCYLAANWSHIGETSGKNWQKAKDNKEGTIKKLFVFPLNPNFRTLLKNEPISQQKSVNDEDFLNLWGRVVNIMSEVAHSYDATWQKRKRIIDSLLLVFLIFRLVFSKNTQSYGTTISEFWHNCHRLKFPLPQKQAISASSFSEARKKLNESIFIELNQRIIQACPEKISERWFGHRLFAVDGSKVNLPRELIKANYPLPQKNSHYPQGLLSCCYQLKSKIPHDFDLVSHGNERQCALAHLQALQVNDVCVYDRGYFSYALLALHIQAGVHPVFRMKKQSGKSIDAFIDSDQTDEIITLMPTAARQREIRKDFPQLAFVPLKIRLIKYVINGTSYCIGTTLMDKPYSIDVLKDVYHARWGIEELYKVSKKWVGVDDFHGRSERTVKQELFAHFVLITMSRLCANASEHLLASLLNLHTDKNSETEQSIQVNFKNTLTTVSRYLEEVFYAPSQCVNQVMTEMVCSISRYYHKKRQGRHYARESKQPAHQWNTRRNSA